MRAGPPDAPVREADTDAATAAARAARDHVGLGAEQSPACWLAVAERGLGARVVVAHMPRWISGAHVPGTAAPVVFVNGAHPVVRQRFTLAHELGHHALGHGAAPRILGAGPDRRPGTPAVEAPTVAAVPDAPAADPARGAREREANFFASELLAPAAGLPGALAAVGADPDAVDLEAVVRLAAGYGVSVPMILVRLETAGVIDRAEKVRLDAACDTEAHLRLHRELGLESVHDELARLAAAPDQLPRLPDDAAGHLLADALDGGTVPTGPLGDRVRALRALLGVT